VLSVPADAEQGTARQLRQRLCLEGGRPDEDQRRNQLQGTVRGMRRGEAIANVEPEVAGQRLVASITVEAVEELGLAERSNLIALIKASDVMLATD
jgi:molybdopterin-binding protein